MRDADVPGREAMLSQALEQLTAALETLDASDAPAHIGAHVDLAIHELYLVIAARSGEGRVSQIDRNAAPQ